MTIKQHVSEAEVLSSRGAYDPDSAFLKGILHILIAIHKSLEGQDANQDHSEVSEG